MVQKAIIANYGLPGKEYRDKWCEIWNVSEDFPWSENIKVGRTQAPFKRVYINKDFKQKLNIAFANLTDSSLYTEIKTFDGCFVERKVRGRNAISLHSWAMAIDFNSETEKLYQKKNGFYYSNFSKEFVKCFTDAGVFWGGNWNRFDPMHFALYNG